MKGKPVPIYHMVVENGNKILVSDCKQILSYSENVITLLLSRAEIRIGGRDLSLCDFFGSEVQINGRIDEIVITRKEAGKL